VGGLPETHPSDERGGGLHDSAAGCLAMVCECGRPSVHLDRYSLVPVASDFDGPPSTSASAGPFLPELMMAEKGQEWLWGWADQPGRGQG